MRVAVLFNSVDVDGPDHADVLAQVAAVRSALAPRGDEIVEIACDLDLGRLWRRLEAEAPDVVFNLVESLAGRDRFLPFVPALLEERGLPFTGSGSESAAASGSKLASKRLLAAAGLPVLPCAAVWPPALAARISDGPQGLDGECQPPFMVKSVWSHGSPGLDDTAVVRSREELGRRLEGLARSLGGAAVAEPYVHGRELNMSLLATAVGVEVLPAAEIVFERYPAGKPHIVGYRAKWEPGSFEYEHTVRRFEFPAADAALLARLRELSLAAWRALGVTGYARVDFRVDARGEPWILEVNANPCLSPDAGFASAVERSGRTLDEAIGEILADALRRGAPALAPDLAPDLAPTA
ncbi:MAG: D-alanine--D-alanine ligase [Acidobacteriota bacterium]|nr:D-alanine--D-alanine ligase [Acidobacteriota bacterium]MDH3524229.1 D-alanine--D-alanine ligase [Acidobacteriota bacterium]